MTRSGFVRAALAAGILAFMSAKPAAAQHRLNALFNSYFLSTYTTAAYQQIGDLNTFYAYIWGYYGYVNAYQGYVTSNIPQSEAFYYAAFYYDYVSWYYSNLEMQTVSNPNVTLAVTYGVPAYTDSYYAYLGYK
jgi:hypothetical protein